MGVVIGPTDLEERWSSYMVLRDLRDMMKFDIEKGLDLAYKGDRCLYEKMIKEYRDTG